MSKPQGFAYINICQKCGKEFNPPNRQPHAKYCGSARLKIGCSYDNQLELSMKWAKEHIDRSREIQRNHYRIKRNTPPERFRK